MKIDKEKYWLSLVENQEEKMEYIVKTIKKLELELDKETKLKNEAYRKYVMIKGAHNENV